MPIDDENPETMLDLVSKPQIIVVFFFCIKIRKFNLNFKKFLRIKIVYLNLFLLSNMSTALNDLLFYSEKNALF